MYIMDRSKFISKELLKSNFQSANAKFIINIWLMTKSQTQYIDDFQDQWLADTYNNEINSFESLDDIIDDIFKYIDSITMPSKLATWIANFNQSEQLRLVCRKWLEKRPILTIPEYTVTEEKLQKIDGSRPSLAILHYLNHLNPQFAGYYLENVLAYCIYDDFELWKDHEVHSISVQILNDADSLTITNNDIDLIKHRCYKGDEFKSLPHAILYVTFLQAVAKKLTSQSYFSFFKFTDTIDDEFYQAQIFNYINDLMSTSVIKSLQRFKNENFHSLSVYAYIHDKYISGELDFYFPFTILDAKCTKTSHISQWAAQLYIYKQLTTHKAQTLQIISFLNNSLYKFTFAN